MPDFINCPYCSKTIYDISGGKKYRIYCGSCGAQYFKKWYTKKEWDEYINGTT